MNDKQQTASAFGAHPTVSGPIRGIRRSLYGNLVFLVTVIVVPIVFLVVWGSQRTQEQLSRNLVDRTTNRAESELHQFFDPIETIMRVTEKWGLSGRLDASAIEDLNRLFMPVLAQIDHLNALVIGNDNGVEYLLLKEGETWLTRLSRAEDWGPRRQWQRFSADGQLMEQYWDEEAYDTRNRRWYRGAIQRSAGQIYWTNPYTFRNTDVPGMTASLSWQQPGEDAVRHVIAMPMTLKDISVFTSNFWVSENGHLAVLTGDGRSLGLPKAPADQSDAEWSAKLLKPVSELGYSDLDQAVALSSAEPMDEPRRFNGEKGKVWSGYRAFNLGSKRRLWIAVVAPEDDFVGDARQKNQALLAIIVGGLVVAFLVGVLIERGLRRGVKEEMSRVTQLGQYTLEEKLGEGGMGTVYRARHSLLRRPTAIKLLRPEKEGDEEAIARFEREVQITSRLTHPNTVAIYDYGRTPDGVFYYAMEYFAGIDMEQLVKVYGPVPPERAVHLLRQVCGSLAEAHDAGLIHRDIKPANIMLCERGGVLDVVKVLDFGMVKDVSMGSQSLDLTQQNMVMGTPMFLAPEAIRKRDDVDGRSDLYAVGAVAYFMLTGRNVFEGDTVIEIVRKHLEELPVVPSTIFPGMPEDLEQIVMDCLAKNPDDRPADARVLIERLELCSVGRHWDQRQARKWWQDSGEMPQSVPGVPSDGLQMTVELHQS